jgi:mannosyltransferase
VLALTALAALARFATLGVQSLWADEGYTAIIAGGSFGHALVPRTESIPSLSYVLLWTWAHVFGDSATALRALPALLGTLTVPAAYVAGVVVRSRRVGLLTAALVALAPLLVWYSQEARSYALYTLLSVLAFTAFVRALQAPDERRPLVWWGVLSALALACHYFAVFTIAAELGYLALRHPRRRRVAAAAAAPAAMGLLLLPLLAYQLDHVPRPWSALFSVSDQVRAVGQEFVIGPTWTPLIHRGGMAVLALLALTGAAGLLRRDAGPERRAALAPLAVAGVTLALPFLIALAGPNYVTPRNVLGAWVPLALVVALGASVPSFTRAGTLVTVAIVAVCGAIAIAVPTDHRLQRDDWQTLTATLGPAAPGRAIVVLDSPTNSAVVRYYRPRAARAAAPATAADVAVFAGNVGTPVLQPPAPGLTLVSQRTLGRLTIARYRAPAPVPIPPHPYGSADAEVLGEGDG